jgi:glycosyltransferase involved in cell wall biosynthesis
MRRRKPVWRREGMPASPRILYVADAYPQSLFAATPVGIVRALRQLGAEVDVVFLSHNGRDVIRGLEKGVHLLRCGRRSYRASGIALLKLFALLARNCSRFDVIIVEPNMVLALVPLSLLRRLGGGRPCIVLDVRTQPVEVPDNLRGRLAEVKFNLAIDVARRFFDGMLVITEEMEKYVRVRRGALSFPVGIWTSGIDTTLFDPKLSYEPLELFCRRFVIMYHGQLSPARGLSNILLALDKVRREYPEVFFFCVGSGAMKGKLQKLVRSLALDDHATIRDPLPHFEIPRYIKGADIGILAFPDLSWWRVQSPLKLFEYLAMETPVIATDIPMNRSVIRSCDCAFLIQDNTPERIAEGIKMAIRNRERLSIMGEAGRKLVAKEFTWVRQAESIIEYLKGMESRRCGHSAPSNRPSHSEAVV